MLKPNFVEFHEGSAINTDPRMVVAAANTMRRLGASSVVVAEGPGHRRDTEAVAYEAGLLDALDDAGVDFVDLNEASVVRTPLDTRYTDLGELWVPTILRDADIVVSMPKLKTHHWVGVTLSLKNCFGCMPGRVYGWPKDVFHMRNVPRSILDIAGAIRPSLVIVDGIVGMEGDGPIRGDAVHSGVVVVSRDPVAADVTGARLMGMDPEKIEYLMEAGRFLGQSRSELIEQRGEDPERLAKSFRPAPGFEHIVGLSSRRRVGPTTRGRGPQSRAASAARSSRDVASSAAASVAPATGQRHGDLPGAAVVRAGHEPEAERDRPRRVRDRERDRRAARRARRSSDARRSATGRTPRRSRARGSFVARQARTPRCRGRS